MSSIFVNQIHGEMYRACTASLYWGLHPIDCLALQEGQQSCQIYHTMNSGPYEGLLSSFRTNSKFDRQFLLKHIYIWIFFSPSQTIEEKSRGPDLVSLDKKEHRSFFCVHFTYLIILSVLVFLAFRKSVTV